MVHFQGLDMSCRYYTTSYRHLVWKQRCFWPTFTLVHCKYLVHTKHSITLLIQGHNCRILAGKTATVASALPVRRRCSQCILFCKIQAVLPSVIVFRRWIIAITFSFSDITHYWVFGCPSFVSEALSITYSVCCVSRISWQTLQPITLLYSAKDSLSHRQQQMGSNLD